ncbi:hypothetical protein GCM10009646_65570 [Streptomyces aureus]
MRGKRTVVTLLSALSIAVDAVRSVRFFPRGPRPGGAADPAVSAVMESLSMNAAGTVAEPEGRKLGRGGGVRQDGACVDVTDVMAVGG